MTDYLIIGGTGKTGRRIARQLAGRGHAPRVGSRNPQGSVAVRFDWDDDRTWDSALDGTAGVWIIPPAFEVDHRDRVAALAVRAAELGVGRAVLLSARGANLDPEGALAQTEAAVRTSGVEWTIVRPTWFAQNFTESFFRPPIDVESVVIAPTADGREPFDAEDIAAVAVQVLTSEGHAGAAYDLSGPEAITFAEAAGELSKVAGREIRHVDPGLDAWRSATIDSGVPHTYADLLTGILAMVRDGHDSHLSNGVQQVLGRQPVAFGDWAARKAGVLASIAA